MPAILATLRPTHPRLLALPDSWAHIQTQRAGDAALDAFLTRQQTEARALVAVEPAAYHKEGRRLLSVSRTVLRRVLLLAMQYKLTGERALLDRARAEMLSAAAFSDWNPSHFLDTAEMTAALAVGCDWLYDDLDPAERETIERAIIEKGLRAGIENNGWAKATNNWNAVCHCGMVLGALAVAEKEPELAARFLEQAQKFNPLGMREYAPAGVYPEGPNYWAYGTTFEVMLIGALQSALGTDWGLSQSAGFMESAGAVLELAGPTGAFYDFSDGGERASLEGTTFWFARQLNRPALANFERATLGSGKMPAPTSLSQRTLPLVALWWTPAPAAPLDLPLDWLGAGEQPLAVFRSSWGDPDAMFLALKGGRATLSHGHMDAGSFVFESDGVRWARDLGMQDYESLESQGVGLWDSRQNGERWSVFRLNNFSHNTLTLNDQLHHAAGEARITRFSGGPSAGATVDLTPVFAGQATRVTRGFSFRAGQDVTIRDEIEGLKAGDDARFALLTGAQIQISGDGQTATLTQKGRALRVQLHSSSAVQWQLGSAQGPRPYDAPNPGAQMLVAHFSAPAGGALSWSVTLAPGAAQTAQVNPLATTALADWPLAPVK